MKVFTPQEMRNTDSVTISERGVAEASLMENAALAAFFVLNRRYSIPKSSFCLFCGGGNNGGDGFALARKLFSHKSKVTIISLKHESDLKGTTRTNYLADQSYGIPVIHPESNKQIQDALNKVDIVIDALLGTGLNREPVGLYKECIDLINSWGKEVFSLDIPSGVDGTTGTCPGSAVKSKATVTFGAPKWGNVLYPGAEKGGRLYCSRLSFHPEEIDSPQIQGNILIPSAPPKRKTDGHKGSFGRILTIGGAAGYFGAPAFAAGAVLKSGGGYSYLAAPVKIVESWAPHFPELVYLPQKIEESGSMGCESLSCLLESSKEVKGVILGPGLSRAAEAVDLTERLVSQTTAPLLLDGDALFALAGKARAVSQRGAPTVLTPHLGELSLLLDTPVSALKENIVQFGRRAAERYNAIVVIKGAHSLVITPEGECFVNMTGNSGMGTAGSGDVLCGSIMGLFAQGMELSEAVKAGVFLHGLAGDLAAEKLGEASLTASDILNTLPEAYVQWSRNEYKVAVTEAL